MLAGVLGGAVALWLTIRAPAVDGGPSPDAWGLDDESGTRASGEHGPVPSEPDPERQLDPLDRAIGRARNGVIITDCDRPSDRLRQPRLS
jgi:hypothetical protein